MAPGSMFDRPRSSTWGHSTTWLPALVLLSIVLSTHGPNVSLRNQESHLFAGLYRSVAQELGCGFFDAATVAKSTAEDGVHLDAANTRAIGIGLVPLVKELLGMG